MALSREQYERIMTEYSARRDAHRAELARRKRHVFAQIPEYRQLDEKVSELSARELDERLFGSGTDRSLSQHLAELSQRKQELLLQHGYPADYLAPVWDCPACRDTGYVDGGKCVCLRQRELQILYRQSRLEDLLRTNNFGLLSEEFYEGADLQHFRAAEESCRSFIGNFGSGYENLFFYGTVGTGKSFLSISTAGEILRMGHSVLYFSAGGLFETISSHVFRSGRKEEENGSAEELYACDLLVIDDLGTEVTNNFVASQLFSLITERDLSRRPTIISTNLSLPELRDRYSDRIFSRITSNYTVRKLTGPDVRIARKISQQQPPRRHRQAAGRAQEKTNGSNQTA